MKNLVQSIIDLAMLLDREEFVGVPVPDIAPHCVLSWKGSVLQITRHERGPLYRTNPFAQFEWIPPTLPADLLRELDRLRG